MGLFGKKKRKTAEEWFEWLVLGYKGKDLKKLNEYKTKIEQWERDGYDVSEWRGRWFK